MKQEAAPSPSGREVTARVPSCDNFIEPSAPSDYSLKSHNHPPQWRQGRGYFSGQDTHSGHHLQDAYLDFLLLQDRGLRSSPGEPGHIAHHLALSTPWWWFSCEVVSDSCDPMDCSLPGSSVYGLLQARILEWIAISSPEDLPHPGVKLPSPALQADSLLNELWGKPPACLMATLIPFGARWV